MFLLNLLPSGRVFQRNLKVSKVTLADLVCLETTVLGFECPEHNLHTIDQCGTAKICSFKKFSWQN